MKMIVAFVQPFMASQVIQALHEVPGVTGASYYMVRGFGRGRSRDTSVQEALEGGVGRMRFEVMIPDELEDLVVRAIQTAAQTGNDGDGKVYVATVERAVRIATGEEGPGSV